MHQQNDVGVGTCTNRGTNRGKGGGQKTRPKSSRLINKCGKKKTREGGGGVKRAVLARGGTKKKKRGEKTTASTKHSGFQISSTKNKPAQHLHAQYHLTGGNFGGVLAEGPPY